MALGSEPAEAFNVALDLPSTEASCFTPRRSSSSFHQCFVLIACSLVRLTRLAHASCHVFASVRRADELLHSQAPESPSDNTIIIVIAAAWPTLRIFGGLPNLRI